MESERRGNLEGEEIVADGQATDDTGRHDWMSLFRQALRGSTSYVEANWRVAWERSIALFQSRHPPGSKYHGGDYRFRTKFFRPKVRAFVRRGEAAISQAMFSTVDVVSINPQDDSDEQQRASAEITNELMNYRLTKTIPWFRLVNGAWQDSHVQGVVASKQIWRYRARESDPTGLGLPQQQILVDRPEINLIPVENLRVDPAACWVDPGNDSPYLIEIIPMYVVDVLQRMEEPDTKTGLPAWNRVTREQLKAARTSPADSTRQMRNEERQDPYLEAETGVTDFDTVWVYEVHMRIDGEDWVYWTLGEQALLTDPVLLRQAYPHLREGERPYVLGVGLIETHRSLPTSIVQLLSDLQMEINDIANLRMDNVKLAVNGRYFVRSDGEVDIESLKRSVPGSVTSMMDPHNDVAVHRPPDVTQSSYEEMDRLSNDFSDLAGTFSQGDVQSNRVVGETVGGMQLLSGAANALQEYDLRVFVETWVEPVLRQLIRLEQYYETDANILALAAREAQLWQQYGISVVDDNLLDQELTLTVDVGIGATDPMQKLQKFLLVLNSSVQLMGPMAMQMLNMPEIITEMFGCAGYKDGQRFFNFESAEDPRLAMMQQQIEMLTQQLESQQMQAQAKVEAAQVGADAQVQTAQIKAQGDMAKLAQQGRGDMMKLAAQSEENRKQAQRDLGKEIVMKGIEGRMGAAQPPPEKKEQPRNGGRKKKASRRR